MTMTPTANDAASSAAHPLDFRRFVRSPDDPRIRGIGQYDAYSFAEHAREVPRIRELLARWDALYAQDFRGITTDGQIIEGLFHAADEGAPAEAMAAAARQLLALVDAPQREALCHPLTAREWRAWMNPEFYVQRHGLRLDEIAPPLRAAVLELLRASLSARGFEKARKLMRINHFLGELVGAPRVLNEFSYNFNLFGTPGPDAPWGWNFYGHHLCLNCLVAGSQMVLTPVFMGAEPSRIDAGPWRGVQEFVEQEALGLELMRSLPRAQQLRACLYAHKRDPAMPPGRVAVGDELHLGGAFQDNRVIPYEGSAVADWGAAARRSLVELVAVWHEHLPSGPLAARLAGFERHLEATHFCWIGGTGDDDPFYYRIQSPVTLLEFDHHAGIFLGNPEPRKFHVHTLMRTPNGNDYGMVHVKRHCERLQHAAGCGCG